MTTSVAPRFTPPLNTSSGVVRLAKSAVPWQPVGHENGVFQSSSGLRYPAEVIQHVVWLYHCFSLSLRNVELILAARGIVVS